MVKSKDATYLFVVLVINALNCLRGVEGSQDICGGYNGRRLYLELGARGVVTAQNITLPGRKSISSIPLQTQFYNGTSHEQCTLELVTCPGCVVSVVFHHLNLSDQCSGVNSVMDSPCHCDYVWLSEPPYEDVSGVPFCGTHSSLPSDGPGALTYRSLTRTLSIVFLYSEVHTNAFSFEYFTERNRQFLKGYPRDSTVPPLTGNVSHGGVIKSPFFPALYPRDLGIEYIIACQPDLTVSCRVRILFHDFQIDVASLMEFYDWNGQRIEICTGSAFRPPVILSSGPSLMVRFYANGGTNLGYKATYSFLSGNLLEKNIKPDTDCGGYVENLGGAITMMNMVTDGIKTYDCVWLIRPPKNYLHLKTHLFLKVATFSDMAGNTELQVLRGLTSEQPVLEMMRHPINQLLPHRTREHIVPVDVGFYVSLRGSFGSASRLAIVYTTFSYSDCFAGADTLCQNHRCIPSQLFCDGFDHCGDNSDEPPTCYQDWKTDARDRHWYSHTPNYYFPKMERYPDLKTATLIFIMCCVGLIMLITALILLLYRMGSRVRHQREIQNHLQTISELLDGGGSEEVPPDEPPVYEAPPDYDDIIKVFIDTAQSERRKLNRDSVNGSTPALARADGISETLADRNSHVSLDGSAAPTPEAVSISRILMSSAPGLLSVVGVNNRRASAPNITSRSCQTTPIPNSPPPPYSHIEGVSGMDAEAYVPTASYTATQSPVCFPSLPQRTSRTRSAKGRKFRKAWQVSRDELVHNLQEALLTNASNNGGPAAMNRNENPDSSVVTNGNSQSHSNVEQHLESSLVSPGINHVVQRAYQLQNEANQIIDQQNLNSLSDQECSNSVATNRELNIFPGELNQSFHSICEHNRQSAIVSLSATRAENLQDSSNVRNCDGNTRSPSLSREAAICSCEGACGCATAEGNVQSSSPAAPELEVSRSPTFHEAVSVIPRSTGSRKSSISSNLLWVSAESQDFI